jgi:DNA-binding MarR family transcriptional regulator
MRNETTSEPGQSGSPIAPLIFQLTRQLRTALERRVAAHDLTLQQALLLIRCVHQPGSSPHEIMPSMGTDNAGISRLVDRLEDAGLIVRRAGPDRRSISLEATDAGAALAPALEVILRETNRELLDGLSAEEVAQLAGLLRRILANAKEWTEP